MECLRIEFPMEVISVLNNISGELSGLQHFGLDEFDRVAVDNG